MSYQQALHTFIESDCFWNAVVAVTNDEEALSIKLTEDGRCYVVATPNTPPDKSITLEIPSLQWFPCCEEDDEFITPAKSSRQYEYRLEGVIASLLYRLEDELSDCEESSNFEF